VIPAREEEETVGITVCSLLEAWPDLEVVVVDDGSRDRTSRRAAEAGARVLRLDPPRGKGGALEAGAEMASGELLLLLDADLGREAPRFFPLLEPVFRGEADMAVAAFPPLPGFRGFGIIRRLARELVFRRTSVLLEAPLSGQRALRREAFERLRPLAPGYGVEVGLSLRALELGLRVWEIRLPAGRGRVRGFWAGMPVKIRQVRDIWRARRG
jgi:glycosyltransferase involved in cell wall biosynthesis